MGLLLRIIGSRIAAAWYFLGVTRSIEGGWLFRDATVLRKQSLTPATMLLILHGQIRPRALGTRSFAAGRLAVGAFDLEGFLLFAFLTLADLFTRGLLIFSLFLLLESAAGFLDGHCSFAGVDFTARTQAEAFVK